MSASSGLRKPRGFEEEMTFLERRDATSWRIKPGFVPGMRVPGIFYVNSALESLVFDELRHHCASGGYGGFLPAIKQIANVAALPGIVGTSIGLPDIHSGYGFAIGNVAAFDMNDPDAIVSPGGVGFDINCGVRVLRTNLTENDVSPVRERLAQSLFDHIPVGVGSKGVIPTSELNLDAALEMGMDWTLREGYSWVEDKEHCFHPNTRLLASDNSVRRVCDVEVGDALMGDDGTARIVTAKQAGFGPMYRIQYGDEKDECRPFFECNGKHQLVVSVATGRRVAPVAGKDNAQVGWCVTYVNLSNDLGYLAPKLHHHEFVLVSESRRIQSCYSTLRDAEAGARAFYSSIVDSIEWEPTVEQFLHYLKQYPSRTPWFFMRRAAITVAPGLSPHLSFSRLLDLAFSKAGCEALDLISGRRIAAVEAAHLVGLWLGNRDEDTATWRQSTARKLEESRLKLAEKSAAGLNANLDFLEGGKENRLTRNFTQEVSLRTKVSAPGRLTTKRERCRHVPLAQDRSRGNDRKNRHGVLVQLLKLMGVFRNRTAEGVREETIQAFLIDSPQVRAGLVAGLIDSDATEALDAKTCYTWQFCDTGGIAELLYRTALSIGYYATISPTSDSAHGQFDAHSDNGTVLARSAVRIAAPTDGDIVSELVTVSAKKSMPRPTADCTYRRAHHLYPFTVTKIADGAYSGITVKGANKHILLADYLVVHNCEEYGRMLQADPSKVSRRAKKRGMPQMGTLGAGNHYAEIQVVDEIHDASAANTMGIGEKGQVVIMIHSGSRGLGHQVATDALLAMERAMERDKGLVTNDRQLACARINSEEGQDYLAAMAAAANYAWVNRSAMGFLARQTFAKIFETSPDDLDMHVVYDVSHNIAKIEEHVVDGKLKTLLVHRKGATRAFPPHHPLIPVDYQFMGQPVLVGGTMGTASWILAGC